MTASRIDTPSHAKSRRVNIDSAQRDAVPEARGSPLRPVMPARMEASRDLGATLEAAIPVHPVALDRVPVADDERRPAARAARRLALRVVHVADVAAPDAALARD